MSELENLHNNPVRTPEPKVLLERNVVRDWKSFEKVEQTDEKRNAIDPVKESSALSQLLNGGLKHLFSSLGARKAFFVLILKVLNFANYLFIDAVTRRRKSDH